MDDGNPKDRGFCPNIERCELFPHFQKAGMLKIWQINYCEADFGRCERYESSQRGVKPPPTMLPNGKTLEHWRPKVS